MARSIPASVTTAAGERQDLDVADRYQRAVPGVRHPGRGSDRRPVVAPPARRGARP
ncbi:MAG TPA: hypothetical protein VGY99_32520 [Candidatus Binataceae bacterium]|nr:hypothetical protein [Candidatus Binataceae bacterium]